MVIRQVSLVCERAAAFAHIFSEDAVETALVREVELGEMVRRNEAVGFTRGEPLSVGGIERGSVVHRYLVNDGRALVVLLVEVSSRFIGNDKTRPEEISSQVQLGNE